MYILNRKLASIKFSISSIPTTYKSTILKYPEKANLGEILPCTQSSPYGYIKNKNRKYTVYLTYFNYTI